MYRRLWGNNDWQAIQEGVGDFEFRNNRLIRLSLANVGDLGGHNLWRADNVRYGFSEAEFPGFNSISVGFRRNGDGYPVVITPKNGIW